MKARRMSDLSLEKRLDVLRRLAAAAKLAGNRQRESEIRSLLLASEDEWLARLEAS